MDLSSNVYETHLERFQSLLSNPDHNEQLAEDVWKVLFSIFESLKLQAEALQLFAESMQASSEPWTAYDFWPFVKTNRFYSEQDRELLLELPDGKEMLALLDEGEIYRLQAAAIQEALEEKILDVWRWRHPKFSSMGVLDSDVRSENLKDAKELAHR